MTSKDLLKLASEIDAKMTELLVNGNHDFGSDDVKAFNDMYFATKKAMEILEKGLKGEYLYSLVK